MPQPKTTLQALLFDVDGTLADTERDGHRPAFNQAFADAGLDWHWDAALYGKLLAVTGGKERMKYYIDRFRPDYRKPDNFDELVAGLHQAKTRHYSALAAKGGIPMRPGVRRLLAEARAAGLRLAIATTTTPENVTVLLEHSLGPGTPDWFEVIAAGDIVPAKKPAPDIYHYALVMLVGVVALRAATMIPRAAYTGPVRPIRTGAATATVLSDSCRSLTKTCSRRIRLSCPFA